MEVARTFLAIRPDASLRADIAALSIRLHEVFTGRGVRWGSTGNYHLTLVFLGTTPLAQITAIGAEVKAVAASLQPFRYALTRACAFPDMRRPRVIALEPGDAAPFQVWQQALAAALTRLGFPPERRGYRPHLSVARVRGAWANGAGSEIAVSLDEGTADRVVLYESRSGRYLPLLEACCGAGATR